jgi:DNA polymerase-3 subunit gamma/tau
MPSAVSSTLDTSLSGDKAAPVPVKKHRVEPSEPLPLAAEVTSVSTQVQVAISEPISSEGAGSPDETPIALSALDGRGWIVLLEKVGLAGMTYNIAANAALVGVDGRQLNFVLNAGQMNMFNDTHKARIQEAVGRYFGQEVGVVFEVGESDQETPAQFRERCRQERQARAVEAIQQDANVEAIIERFDARLEMSSIRPIDPS